jgi:formyl-CoA transferase
MSDSISEVTRSPLLGEHTDEILRTVLGYSDQEIGEIHSSGATKAPEKSKAAAA